MTDKMRRLWLLSRPAWHLGGTSSDSVLMDMCMPIMGGVEATRVRLVLQPYS